MGFNCIFPSIRKCFLISSVIIAIETALMATLNFLVILCCSCVIFPHRVKFGSLYMARLWSWFLFDMDKCESKGNLFSKPEWYHPPPIGFLIADNYNLVNQHANYIYQIIFFILNSLWMLTSILLVCGGMMQNLLICITWLILGIISFLLDTVVTAFYISFIIKADVRWRSATTIFTWIVFYSRGFIFYILNAVAVIIGIVFVLDTLADERRKRITDARMRQPVIEMTSIPSTSRPQNVDPDPLHRRSTFKEIFESIEPEEYTESSLDAGPSKSSVFERPELESYTNPGFESNDLNQDEKTDPSITNIKMEDDNEIPGKK